MKGRNDIKFINCEFDENTKFEDEQGVSYITYIFGVPFIYMFLLEIYFLIFESFSIDAVF